MGGAIGGARGGHGPSNNLVGGAILYLAPQYFALEFKILTLDLMQIGHYAHKSMVNFI